MSLTQSIHKLTGNRFRGLKKKIRHAFAPVTRTVFGTFGIDELEAEITKHIGGDYEILFVHSSVDRLYPLFIGDAFQLLQMFEKMQGSSQTLVMPAFFFGDSGGDMIAWYRDKPVFKSKRTPSQMGILTELFRRSPDVKRSLHPTHSICARGALAKELTANHHLAETTFGIGTPYDIMNRHKTVILGMGIPPDLALTQMHHVEDILGDEFPVKFEMVEIPVTIIDEKKNQFQYNLRKPFFEKTRNASLLFKLMRPDQYEIWSFHGIPMFKTTAGDITQTLLDAAKKGRAIYGKG
ncbi:MAG: AAC(3) family N-acetyltransferase [Candidatus Electryonea clarkiae]|nr:AAC(3) family N-acetyltransferase [Candidatus Electryonea clarkiae]